MSRSLLLAAFALTACQTGVAPADDRYDADLDGSGRSTALGERTVLEGPAGTHDFGRNVALTPDDVVVTERAAGTPCANRLRVYTRGAGDALTEATVDCAVPNAWFGDALSAHRTDEFFTGVEAFWPGDTAAADGVVTASDATPSDDFGAASALLSWNRVVVAGPRHGLSGAAWVFEQTGTGNWTEVAKLTHPGVAPGAALGTTVMGSGDLAVLGDALGRSIVFERHETGAWLAVETPEPRILAVHGTTVLAEPSVGSDLFFYEREAGAWTMTGVLHDAKGQGSVWVFDEVAAFGAQASAGSASGWVDRYTRIDGELDASVRLTTPHTDVNLALDGGWLAVGLARSVGTSGTGQVHLFDWKATRDALQFAMTCPAGDDDFEPNDAMGEALPFVAGRYSLTEISRNDYWTVTVPAGQRITALASFVHAEGDIDLELLDAAGNRLEAALTTASVEEVSWINATGADATVVLRPHLYGQQMVGCTTYDLGVVFDTPPAPEPAPTCDQADVTEPNESAAAPWPTLPQGTQIASAESSEDWYALGDALPGGILPNETVRIDLTFLHADGDLDLRLTDANGTNLVSSMSVTDNESVTWTNLGAVALDARVRVQLYNGQPGVCVPYTVALELVSTPAE